ncbi:hypothetical protein AQ616_02465 [Oceanobacillus sp. E9]|uniref:hypothetical protein n=1 Tax=Oceanobacillus sp. E9 TaxID=1742575 RepID=UPI00084E7F42|nr:hypothetical protein [Oceanobacillus sp. E9]OEH56401.1 hypothetical protein AQ616_02465 [Oceanobacillus sp. E9]
MALKKVRRPVLNGEKEILEKKGWNNVMEIKSEFKDLTRDVEKGWNSPIAPSQSVNSDHSDSDTQHNFLNEDINIYESTKHGNDSALNRTISFFGDYVKMPRKAKLEPDIYEFRIDNMTSKENLTGKFGTYDQLFITFSVQKFGMEASKQITIPYIISTKAESPFMVFIASFKSIFQGQNITITQLVGMIGTCEITHFKTASGDVYERLLVKSVNS